MSEFAPIPETEDDMFRALARYTYDIIDTHYNGCCPKCGKKKDWWQLNQTYHIKQHRVFFSPDIKFTHAGEVIDLETDVSEGHAFYVGNALRSSCCDSIISREKDGHFMVLGQIIVSKHGEKFEYDPR